MLGTSGHVDCAVLGTSGHVDCAVLGTLVRGRPVYFGFGSCSPVLCASGLMTLVVRAVVGATRELGCPLLLPPCHDDAALRCFLEVASEEEAPTTALLGFREMASEEEAAALEAMAQEAMAQAAPSWAASHEAPSWAAPSGSSPQRIRIVHSDELPLHEVFTACRAVIHHAGAGRL